MNSLDINYNEVYAILRPNGMESCDYWFLYENGLYHAYYLESENFPERQRIAHAVSSNLKNWQYCGVVLEVFKDKSWPDMYLATGSTVKADNRYYMLFTGHDTKNPGLGLAVSTDLYNWTKVGDGPVIPENTHYMVAYQGKEHECHIMADPYILPKKIDGWFYAYVNSWAVDCPYNSRGCQLMFRTKNFIDWEPYKIAVLTENLDRLETCQVWEHGGKWYMYFGGRRIDPSKGPFADIESNNYVYQADCFDGPYIEKDWSVIQYDSDENCYIQKVIQRAGQDDTVLIMAPYQGVLNPQRVIYGSDGSVKFCR